MTYMPYSPDPNYQPPKKNNTAWMIIGTAVAAVVATFAVVLAIGWFFADGPGAEPAADYKYTGNVESISAYYPYGPATNDDVNEAANAVCNALESGISAKEAILMSAEEGATPLDYGKFVQATQLEYCPQFGVIGTKEIRTAAEEDLENRNPTTADVPIEGYGNATCGLLRNGMDFNTMALNVAGNTGRSIEEVREFLTRLVAFSCPNQPIP